MFFAVDVLEKALEEELTGSKYKLTLEQVAEWKAMYLIDVWAQQIQIRSRRLRQLFASYDVIYSEFHPHCYEANFAFEEHAERWNRLTERLSPAWKAYTSVVFTWCSEHKQNKLPRAGRECDIIYTLWRERLQAQFPDALQRSNTPAIRPYQRHESVKISDDAMQVLQPRQKRKANALARALDNRLEQVRSLPARAVGLQRQHLRDDPDQSEEQLPDTPASAPI